ncbi:hypothetical protein HDU91_005284 [Kappamyces sp. JEL0680]|nr:hypothetical protein HDU91_005284 [Kappamyces sp. JEL0680]
MTSHSILSDQDLELVKSFIREKKSVCLQFPDSLLVHGPSTVAVLETVAAPDCKLYLMADTTFGSCCIDKVAGEHGNADGIIHFGPACLSKPSDDSPPVLWVFDRSDVDLDKLQHALEEVTTPCVVVADSSCYHIFPELRQRLSSKNNLIWSSIRREFNPLGETLDATEIQGRIIRNLRLDQLHDTTLFYIGEESLTLTNIMMTVPSSSVLSFSPQSGAVTEQRGQANTLIRRRFAMVQKAKDANTVGIVVGTLGVARYLDVIQSLKTLVCASGRKPYLLAVGKPSPAKLGNFLEIDVFCLVACPENSLLDSREFLKPIVTPYELSLALDPTRYWNPSLYELNLEVLDPKIKSQISETEQRNEDGTMSDEEPHFSLVTGGFAVNKHYTSRTRKETAGPDALVKRWDGTVSSYVSVSAGAEYLQSRSFQGLEVDLGSQVAELEIGREGIARGYSHEKKP